jgi:hypothetical protein
MNAPKFTPGPWAPYEAPWVPGAKDLPQTRVARFWPMPGAYQIVADCGLTSVEESLANTRLIAEAPALYAIAHQLVTGDGSGESLQRALDLAHAALARVHGVQA